MCSETIADEHQHVVNVAGRQLMCVCRGCYLLFTDSQRRAALPRGARPVSGVPGFRAGPPRVGGTADPGRRGLLLHQLRTRAHRRLLPGPAGAMRIRAGPGRLERHQRRRPAGRPAGRRRGGAAGPGARTDGQRCANRPAANAISFRSTPATSSSGACACCGAVSTAARRRGSSSTASSRRSPPAPGRRRDEPSEPMDVNFAVLDVAPEPYAVTPVLTARVGVAAGGDDPVHAIALRCQVRIEPLRRSYSDDEAAGLTRPVRAPRTLGDHPAHLPLAALHRDGAGLRRQHDRGAAAGLHLRLRGHRRQVPARAARRRAAPPIPVQRNDFRQVRTRLLGPAGVLGLRGSLRHAGHGLAGPDRPALSEQRVGAAEPRNHRRAGRLQVGARDARPRPRGHLAVADASAAGGGCR